MQRFSIIISFFIAIGLIIIMGFALRTFFAKKQPIDTALSYEPEQKRSIQPSSKKIKRDGIDTIIFDLHGVLLEKNRSRISSYISTADYLAYAFSSTTKNADLEERYKAFLSYMASHDQKDHMTSIAYHNGEALPMVMNEWFKGKKHGKDVVQAAEAFMKEHKNFFLSEAERRLMSSITQLMLPEVMAHIIVPVEPMCTLIKDCKKQNHKKFKLIVLSNWDKESFTLLKEKYKDFFNHFDEIFISGHLGTMKPEDDIYQHVLEQCNVEPHNCLFIDDEEANILAARKHGINAFVHEHPVKTRKKLMEYGILQSSTTATQNPRRHAHPSRASAVR